MEEAKVGFLNEIIRLRDEELLVYKQEIQDLKAEIRELKKK